MNYHLATSLSKLPTIAFSDTLGVDTETTGFDPHTQKLLTVQYGDYDNQIIIDWQKADQELKDHTKEILENSLCIFQNAAFDLRWLWSVGIFVERLYDTYLAEMLINFPTTQPPKNKGFRYTKLYKKSLDAIAKRYCPESNINKDDRGLIHREGLSPRVLEYCANDVKYLIPIMKSQSRLLKKLNLIEVAKLEFKAVLGIAYMTHSGFRLRIKDLEKEITEEKKALEIAETNLNKIAVSLGYTEVVVQELFGGSQSYCIKWSSPKEVLALMRKHIDPKLKNADKTALESHIDKPLVKEYLDYAYNAKLLGTYGEKLIKLVGKGDRIYPQFRQIISTGRMSSGGDENSIFNDDTTNFQNFPSKRRELFEAAPGNVLLIADYSNQEQVILADRCKDKAMVAFFVENKGDFHSDIARGIFPKLEKLSDSEIKEDHNEERQLSKVGGFTIAYGGSKNTIANRTGCSKDLAQTVIDGYYRRYPGVKKFQDIAAGKSMNRGYILLNPTTRRKFFLKWIENPMFHQVKRWACNYPIQGTGGDIIKTALYLLFSHIIDEGKFGKILLPNAVHDEIVMEVPEQEQDYWSKCLKICMEKASAFHCRTVHPTVEVGVSKIWNK